MGSEPERRLAWSHSRARAFRDGCPRAYWYTYYGSWGGWARDASPEHRDLWLQKKLTGRAAWVGTLVHQVASRGLARAMDGLPEDVALARAWAVRTAEEQLARSADGSWTRQSGWARVGLREHYYGEELPPDHTETAVRDVETLVAALHAHPWFRRMLAVPERIAEQEVLREFTLDGDTILVSLDAMLWDRAGGAVIVDWKTGERHDDSDIAAQLGAYGLYATTQREVPPDRIRAAHVNLRTGEVTQHAVGPAEIEAARARIAADLEAMRARLSDVPANEADAEAYPTLPEGDPRCGRCNFRKACGRTIRP